MSRKTSHDSGVYKYLLSLGVLHDTPEAQERAKRAYWNQVKRQWKKDRAQKEKSFTISFTQVEFRDIAEAATMHNMSRSRFIKSAALAYVQKKYLVLNSESIQNIKALLSLTYSALQELYELDKAPADVGQELLARMDYLEHQVLQQLIHPKLDRQ